MVVDSSKVLLILFCLQVEKALLPEPALIYPDHIGMSGAEEDCNDVMWLCREETGKAKA